MEGRLLPNAKGGHLGIFAKFKVIGRAQSRLAAPSWQGTAPRLTVMGVWPDDWQGGRACSGWNHSSVSTVTGQ